MTSNNIRLLLAEEVPLILPLIRQFYLEGNLPGELNESHFVTNLQRQIQSGSSFILASGFPIMGTIAGIVHEDMSTKELSCMEIFWYVDKNERGTRGLRLLQAWEEEAKRRGAKKLLMAHLAAHKMEKFEKMYEHRGYKLLEQIYMKQVD